MKTNRFLFLVAFLTALITITGFQDSPQYKILFEKAKFTMETKGDLNGAIDLFNEIIKKYPKEREYAAKSQLYIGLCYEKLGLEEAQKAYRKVLDNYPEQKQEVAMARENLNRLLASLKVPDKPVFRKINIPTTLRIAKLSPDGKELALVSDKKLWKVPLSGKLGQDYSGTPFQINTDSIEVENSGLNWSYDGKWIAFNEFPETLDSLTNQWICIVSSNGGKPIKVIRNFRAARLENYSISISPDKKTIAYSVVENGEQHIYKKPIDIGSSVQMVDIQSREPAFSPDGKWIAYVEDKNLGYGGGNLYIVPSGGGTPRLIANAEYSTSPVWSPDNKMIAFVDYGKKDRIQIAEVPEEAKESGKTISINIPEKSGTVNLLTGWTTDNKIGAVISGKKEGVNEFWFVQNFLPEEKTEKNLQLTLTKLDNNQLNSPYAEISPDGKKIAYCIDGKPEPGIGILDLETGAAKMLVERGEAGLASKVWSPQSDKIAFRLNGNELHIGDINGSNSQLFFKSPEFKLYPTDWSRDGKKILCFFMSEDLSMRIGTITFNGQVKFLATGSQSEFSSKPKFSPDGRYIACSLKDANGNSDIFILSSDGSQKVRVAANPGRDENPVWSQDGKYLLFISDRNRSADLWGISTENGKALGAPFIIKRDIGWRTLIQDLTANGKLFLFMMGGDEPGNIYTIPVDQTSNTLKSPINPVSVFPTDHSFPRCSPNGKMIAYLSRRGQVGWPKLYVINEEGAERELFLQGHYAVNIAWHSGNQSLFFAGWDKTFKPGIYEISLETGDIKPVYINEFVDFKTGKGRLININLLPDEGKLIFFKFLENENVEVLSYTPGARQPEVILPEVKMPIWGLPSPTGKYICYNLGDSLMIISVLNGSTRHIGSSTRNLEATWSPDGEYLMFREGSSLRLYSLNENNSRTLYKSPAGKTFGGMEMYANSWSPNGKLFIIAERDTSASSTSPQKLIMINPVNGSVSTLGEAPHGCRLSELRWSPEGGKVIATGNNISTKSTRQYEYWMLENFLPE